jgi:hypothetical protein
MIPKSNPADREIVRDAAHALRPNRRDSSDGDCGGLQGRFSGKRESEGLLLRRFSDAGRRHAESEPQPEPAGVRKPPEKETAGMIRSRAATAYGDLKALPGETGVARAGS